MIVRKLVSVLIAVTPLVAMAEAATLDLSGAVVVVPGSLSGPEEKAVAMLIEEVEARTTLRWSRVSEWPSGRAPVVALATVDRLDDLGAPPPREIRAGEHPAEGYRIRVRADEGRHAIWVVGNDSRGLLFGIGHLLRKLELRTASAALAQLETARDRPAPGSPSGRW